MKVVYLRKALRDLQSIRNYVAKFDVNAADRVVAPIQQAATRLENFPYSGRASPAGVRLLSVTGLPYTVIHRLSDNSVKIVAVFHTSRNRRF